MADFEIKGGVAIIPDGTKKIKECAFLDCTSLKSITIPESVTEIGYCAFDGCTSLVAINVPAKRSRNYKWYLRPIVYDKVVELAPEKETKK